MTLDAHDLEAIASRVTAALLPVVEQRLAAQADQLAALAEQVAALRDQRAPRGLLPGDHLALQRLLPAVLLRTGRNVFTVGELIAHAQLHTDLAEAIQAAAGAALQEAPKRLGKLLARAAGVDVDGLRIVRFGSSRDGALWACEGFATFKAA